MFTTKYSPASVALWIKYYFENSVGILVEADNEGNVYAVGKIGITDTYDYLIQKFNANGDSLWTRYYDYGNADEPIALKIDHAGNIVVTGSSYGTGGFYGTRWDYATVKYSPSGELLWSERFHSGSNFEDLPKGMAIDAEDNIYITGQTHLIYGTVKYNTGGTLLWEQYWQRQSANGNALAIVLDEDANVYVTGTSNHNIEVLKYNKNGLMKWDTIFLRPESQSNVPTSIVVDSDKDIFITGYVSSTVGSWSDWITLKYSQLEQPVELKVFLEGSFNGTDMNTDLNNAGMLPLAQPYNVLPWNYSGNESVSAIPNPDIVDWVLIEFRDAVNAASALPSTTIARKACFLLKDGTVVDLDGSSPIDLSVVVTDNLFIVVNHRNHLAVMSSGAVAKSGIGMSWDFTSQLENAYLGGQKQIGPGVFGMIGGDSDGNGIVETADLEPGWDLNAGIQDYVAFDLNLDSQINNPDKNDIWLPNIGSTSKVPTTGAFDCGGELFDIRDGQSYNTVQIGSQCWMSENMNIGIMIPQNETQSDNNIIEKYCYDDNSSEQCATYGGLYRWDEMMQYEITPGVQGICPENWHLPMNEEWCTLAQYVDPTVDCEAAWGWTGTDAGVKLKSAGGWNNGGNGTDDYGFSALPGGYIDSGYGYSTEMGETGYFWSSTIIYGAAGIDWFFSGGETMIGRSTPSFHHGFSVRCVKD
jgi:uncharacterized protein (TIGR02145 family)